MTWPYDHPTNGTCPAACPRAYRCHCAPDCEARPTVAHASDRNRGYVIRRPYLFAAGHNRPWHTTPGSWGTNGVPRVKFLPYFERAVERAGSVRALSRMLSVPEGTLFSGLHFARRGIGRMSPVMARRVLMVAHGLGPDDEPVRQHPRDPLTTFDTDTMRYADDRERDRAETYAQGEYVENRKQKRFLPNLPGTVHPLDEKTRNRIDRQLYREKERAS